MTGRHDIGTAKTSTLASISVAVGVLVLAIKLAAWLLTGSVALFSDAMELIVNVAGSTAALCHQLRRAPGGRQPPLWPPQGRDFSVVLEGVLIIVAAIAILREAYGAFLSPRMFDAPVAGLVVSAVASAINGAWCWFLIREGGSAVRRRWLPTASISSPTSSRPPESSSAWSPPISPDPAARPGACRDRGGQHSLGRMAADPRIARRPDGRGGPGRDPERNPGIISANAEGAIEAHDLRTRLAGRATFIDFHLVVVGSMPVTEAHGICDRIEKALRVAVPDAMITIHVEPEEKAKHHGVLVL